MAEPELRPEPVVEHTAVVPDRPRPRLAVVTRQPVGAVVDFMHEGVKIIEGQQLGMVDAYIGYQGWCKRMGLRPVSVPVFSAAVEDIGLRVKKDDDRYYLVNMQLIPVAASAKPGRPHS